MGPEPWVPVSYTYSKTCVWSWTRNTYNCRWRELSTYRQTKELFSRPIDAGGADRLIELPRHRLRLILQILTDHGNYGTHLKTTGKRESDNCGKCDLGVESREHIIQDCPDYARQRRDILVSNLPHLGDLVNSRKFRQISEYLVQTGRLEEFDG